MAVVHGKETDVFVSGFDLTDYLRSVNFNREIDLPDATTYGHNFRVYIPGLQDSTASLEGLYDGAPDALDQVLSDAMDTGGQALFLLEGNAFGKPAYGFGNVESSFETSAEIGDLVQISAEFQTSTEIDRCLVLEPKGTAKTVTGVGTNIDHGASTALGLVGYIQVFAAPSAGTLVLKIQHSVDNAAWADLLTFATVNGAANVHAHERKEFAVGGTINRHLRATWTLAGGITSATFVVAARRKTATV